MSDQRQDKTDVVVALWNWLADYSQLPGNDRDWVAVKLLSVHPERFYDLVERQKEMYEILAGIKKARRDALEIPLNDPKSNDS